MYIGFYTDDALPVTRGQTVTILKGTPIWHRGATVLAGRTYKIKIDHVLNGCTDRRDGKTAQHLENPKVRWPGAGGYWSAVDINLIPEAGVCKCVCGANATQIVEGQPLCTPHVKELSA